MNDTIFALSSGHGRAGIAVVRVSGKSLKTLFTKICQRHKAQGIRQIKPRYAYLVDLVAPEQNEGGLIAQSKSEIRNQKSEIIDRAVAIYFATPNSFTGEDVIEFHVHGSPAVIEKLFETLRAHGARMAQPGEFSRRAFDHGKMDLAEVDGLVSLLDARTERQRAAALKSMTGADSSVFENWRLQMIEVAAYASAMLDFPSDELPANIGDKLLEQTKSLSAAISAALGRARASRAITHGFNIVLVGEVNAGKSSLFNRLLGQSRAIVSDIPGTTRDVVSAELDIDGYLVRLSDTAGLRDATDEIEKIGIEKTNQEIEDADLVIRVLSRESQVVSSGKSNEIVVINKCDLLSDDLRSRLRGNDKTTNHESRLFISAKTGAGVPELLDLIKKKLHDALDSAESDIAVNERARGHLERAVAELESAIGDKRQETGDRKHKIQIRNQKSEIRNISNSCLLSPLSCLDMFAEHVRIAADEIGQILGLIGTDEIRDAVFGQLCLGK